MKYRVFFNCKYSINKVSGNFIYFVFLKEVREIFCGY